MKRSLDNSPLRVMTVVGTRPELIRLSRTIPLFDSLFDHTLIHTGQNFNSSLRDVFFDELSIREPDYSMSGSKASEAQFLASTLPYIDGILDNQTPDAFVVLGDTNSSLTALLAKKRAIPVYHLEAGNRSFDPNVPEEINRKIIDHLADYNFPYSERARSNLLAEGLHPSRVVLSGSPLPEVLEHYAPLINNSTIVGELSLRDHGYIVVSAHRQENVDSQSRLRQLISLLTRIRDRYKMPILVSTHPRTRDRLSSLSLEGDLDGMVLHEPFGFPDYIHLQRNAYCVLSDSGTLSEEASICRFPAVTLRQAIERPEAMETGTLPLSDLDSERAIQCLDFAVENYSRAEVPAEYQVRNFSHRIASVILSTAHSHRERTGIRPRE